MSSLQLVSWTGAVIQVPDASSCNSLATPFFVEWCTDLVTFSLSSLPVLPPGATMFPAKPDVPLINAAFAWAFLRGDPSVCDVPYVALWVAIGGHIADGSGACRSSVAYLSSRGYVRTTDDSTGESMYVGTPPPSMLRPTGQHVRQPASLPPSSGVGVPTPYATISNCNFFQTTNGFAGQTAYSPGGLRQSYSTISEFNYGLCTGPTPIQSGSGAWSALEGPHPNGSFPLNDIIQIGYWKCGSSIACALTDIPLNQMVIFEAWGEANDPLHFPTPHFVEFAPSGNHTFNVTWSPELDWWILKMDGQAVDLLDLNIVGWSPVHAETSGETWNCGDELGGNSGAPETFSGSRWADLRCPLHAHQQA